MDFSFLKKYLWFVPFLLLLFPVITQAGELPYSGYNSSNYSDHYDASYLYSDHFEAAYSMKAWGIFDGYEDGTFGALDEINRAQLAKVLSLSSGITDEEIDLFVANYDTEHGMDDYFLDLDLTQWYVPYVRYAQIQGWVSGHPDGTYKPADPVLMSEAFKMILESQYGTPDSSYAGEEWYDLYLNPFLDLNLIYESSSGYLYYTYQIDLVGFDAVVGSKATRKDIAELLYRIRMALDWGEGELSDYDPLITLEEYEEMYGATVEEVEEGVLKFLDPYFGFEAENIYIGDFEIEDLKLYIVNPSGFENGWYTQWKLMYPTLESEYDDEQIDHSELFTISIFDPDYGADDDIYSNCQSTYGRPFDLWGIYETLCGENGEDSDGLDSLLRLVKYGEIYDGEESDLVLVLNGPFSILHFNEIVSEVSRYVLWAVLDYDDPLSYMAVFEGLLVLESENSDHEESMLNWLENFEALAYDYLELYADISTSDEALDEASEALESVYFDELDGLFVEYEKEIIKSFGETIIFDIEVSHVDDFGDSGLIVHLEDYGEEISVIEGDVQGDYLNSITLYISNESIYNFWLDEPQGVILSQWIRITIKNDPLESSEFDLDFDDENQALQYIFHTTNGNDFENAYYSEVLEIEFVEE